MSKPDDAYTIRQGKNAGPVALSQLGRSRIPQNILARIEQHMDIELDPSSQLRQEITKLLAILRN